MACATKDDHVRVASHKRLIHSQLNWAILLCDIIPEGEKKEQTAQF